MSLKKIQFKAQSVPPKKSKQLWSDPIQSNLVWLLRESAFNAKISQSLDKYTCYIGLDLTIWGQRNILDKLGDLDNILSGVCDGLALRPQNQPTKISPWPLFEENEVFGPTMPLLYDDDKIIQSMKAIKKEVDEEPYYTVKIYPL